MSIGFNAVPSNLRVPFVTAEFDASKAVQGSTALNYVAMIIGQRVTGQGDATDNTLYRVTNPDQVAAKAGVGSMLHRQALAWFNNNKFTETWIGVLADHGSAVKASGTLTVTVTTASAGTVYLYIGGSRIVVPVAAGDSDDDIAGAIEDAINADVNLPVTASAASEVVTVTAKNGGAVGNDIDMRLNYNYGEALPDGVSIAVVQLASGATNPTLTSLISAMGDTWFNVLAFPYTDSTSLTAIEDELASRFGPMRMIDGVAFTASEASLGSAATLGESRNSPHVSIISCNAFPTPTYEIAAMAAAQVAYHGNIDPARPYTSLELTGALQPAVADQQTIEERNSLLYDGISTLRNAAGGKVQIERLITTYQTNAAGADDEAYLDVNTMTTLMYLRYSFRTRIMQRYPRHKLANDGTRYGSGQPVITPKLGQAECLLWFREMETLGLVENFDSFKSLLVVERNDSNVNRLDFLLPPDLINQFLIGAANIQFRL